MAADTLLARITALSEAVGDLTVWATDDYAPSSPAPTFSESNAAVTMAQSGSAWTGVRADIGHRSGKWYFEVEIVTAGAEEFAVGLAASDASIGAEPGSDAYTLGAFGSVGIARWKHNATTTDDGGANTYGEGTNIGVCVDLESRSVWIFAGATYWGGGDPELGTDPTFSGLLPADWRPAVWGNGTTKFRIIHSGFQYTAPAGFRTDWYAIDYQSTVLRVSNNGYSAYESTTWRNWLARIKGDPVIETAVGCVVFGDRKTNQSFGELSLYNNDGGLDYLLQEQGWRGAKVELFEGSRADAFADFQATAVMYVDDLRAVGEREIRLTLRDRGVQLDVPANPGGAQLVVGVAYSCPLVALPDGTYLYQASEYEFIAANAVRDKGVLLEEGTGFTYITSSYGAYGIDLVTEPAGTVVADIYGSPIVDASIITGSSGGDFTTWSGGAPVGWTTVETGGDTVIQVGNAARISVGVGKTASIAQGSLLDGKAYQWRIDATSFTSGSLKISQGGTAGTLATGIAWAGRHQGIFSASSDGASVKIEPSATTTNITIDEVRVWRVRTTTQLREAIIYIAGLAGVAEGEISSADLADLIATYYGEAGGCWPRTESVGNVLSDVVNGFCGWWYFDETDKLRVGRLKGPAAEPALTITSGMIIGDVSPEIDRAPGLSNVVAGKRNWQPYTDDQLVPVGASMTAADRAMLQDPFRLRVTGSGTLAPEYGHAVGASNIGRCTPEAQRLRAGIATLFNTETDCQRLADELTSIYSQLRRWFQVTAALSRADATSLQIGDTVRLESDRFGLSAGQNFVLLGKSRRPLSNVVTLRLWG